MEHALSLGLSLDPQAGAQQIKFITIKSVSVCSLRYDFALIMLYESTAFYPLRSSEVRAHLKLFNPILTGTVSRDSKVSNKQDTNISHI